MSEEKELGNFKINEIFYSLQGEGFYSGQAAVFVRFSGCSLKCSFCDTNFEEKLNLTLDQLIEEIEKLIPNSLKNEKNIIIFTGGEPLLQLNESLLYEIKRRNYLINIETNGTIEVPVSWKKYINCLTISPKIKEYPYSLKQFWGDELKIVFQNQTQEELDAYLKLNFNYFYLQPCSMQNIPEIIEIIKNNKHWQLSLQIQKILNIQ